jgi:putative SOS response-associated peptidase YedK
MLFRPSFTATFDFGEIRRLYNIRGEIPPFKPRYNIQPAQYVPVILRAERGNEAKLMKWGLVPSWVLDIATWDGLPYAQAETLLEKRSFKQLVDSRRCLIPADGFYEWRNDWRKKTPIWYHLKEKKPFAFAGLWDSWRNIELGDTLETFTIITTTANALIRQIRNRMPVIFDRECGNQWLDSRLSWICLILTVARPIKKSRSSSNRVVKAIKVERDYATCPCGQMIELERRGPVLNWKKVSYLPAIVLSLCCGLRRANPGDMENTRNLRIG